MQKKSLILIFIISLLFSGHNQYNEKKYWIFFKDKGLSKLQIEDNLNNIKKKLPANVLKRRSKTLPAHGIVDMTDLPLFQPYLDELKNLQIQPNIKSKWLNAISAKLTSDQVKIVKSLPFVKNVQPVISYIRRDHINDDVDLFSKSSSTIDSFNLDYGQSFTQNNVMRVPEVHQMGINGSGILVGMLDTGFNYKSHEAFSKLQVIAEYDFINNDEVTENEDNDSKNQHNHGTKTLSVIAGFKEGQLIGPAYGAKYILGKTEYVQSETIIEEDYWVAGIEWMEEKGVDVVNSSLGYNDWYTYKDMDGNTAITTIAADLAVKKGIVVVNSMGNEGNYQGSIIAPADGDSVISVGAVNNNGELTSFSSIGPTYDNRIKPDVVAMGTGVYVVSPSSINSYTYSSGTSFSSPLTAGVVTLLLSARPNLTPSQVRDALRNTADNFYNPNNEYGWGLVNANNAIIKDPKPTSNFVLYQNYPNPFNNRSKINFYMLIPGHVILAIYNTNGQLVKILANDFHQIKSYQKIWDGSDTNGVKVASGVYFYRLKSGDYLETKKMLLLH